MKLTISIAQTVEIGNSSAINLEPVAKMLPSASVKNISDSLVLSGIKNSDLVRFDKKYIESTNTVNWIDLQIQNNNDENIEYYLGTDRFEFLDLWIKKDGKIIDHQKSGMSIETKSRSVKNQGYSFFKIICKKGETLEIWLKTENKNFSKNVLRTKLPLTIMTSEAYGKSYDDADSFTMFYLGATFLLVFFIVLLLLITLQKTYIYFLGSIVFNALFLIGINPHFGYKYFGNTNIQGFPNMFFGELASIFVILFTLNLLEVKKHYPVIAKILYGVIIINLVAIVLTVFGILTDFKMMISNLAFLIQYPTILVFCVLMARKRHLPSIMMFISILLYVIGAYVSGLQYFEILPSFVAGMSPIRISEISSLIYDSIFALIMGVKINEERNLRLQRELEKQEILAKQNEVLEKEVASRTKELEKSLQTLKDTQTQLVQSEKLASLGELTAGIAHEIQNPLNFVNNFSELNSELIDELNLEIVNKNEEAVKAISDDIKQNSERILTHGKRASEIVKSMLLHSRKSTGLKEVTDINQVADEYLRLSYHGFRAKEKAFNADFEAELAANLPKVKAIPQDIGRVLLNLLNNAFYAAYERSKIEKDFKPKVLIKTSSTKDAVIIKVIDNGFGISEASQAKIFQPFFTTKPTGEGTGLGLSLSYEIITKDHGGSLEVSSEMNKGTEFTITLPLST